MRDLVQISENPDARQVWFPFFSLAARFLLSYWAKRLNSEAKATAFLGQSKHICGSFVVMALIFTSIDQRGHKKQRLLGRAV